MTDPGSGWPAARELLRTELIDTLQRVENIDLKAAEEIADELLAYADDRAKEIREKRERGE